MERRALLPPLNPTRAFEATGRLLSISKAADELAVTPAAVSRQVRTLEAYLGVDLFERVKGRLELTSAGARYLAELMPLFAALREATDSLRSSERRARVLKIRSPATFAVRWLIPRLASFHRLHENIDVQLTTSPAPLNFAREDIDAGIQLGDGKWPGLRVQRLIANELVPVAAPSRQVKARSQLQGETLLHTLARPEDWTLWLKAAGLPLSGRRREMRYETSLLAYQAAIEGHGVAIAQKALVRSELESGLLVAPFSFELDRGNHTYYFAWPTARPQSDALKIFRRWLHSLLNE
ncbi:MULTISPECIES: LysR substrate-binding domain-containing protein [Caballeronia]|jgi:LysR family glycine cleavage system transcriptional activator|uniref:LysR family transcriptional regulator n=1 Tax=Caballeronia zhejiangensis TaxID=871203 RepID=A0A656QS06_9BURK|nr:MULTISPECIES: LysR substrate-binding domain-containing protein [Caballeronia]EKS71103.1 LysR family transcriptional regulator [Burkholderia sp. SJ98]KDR34125.1 LysR family transcriptional regulator [Caballeronia zhejiangensis]MCG7403161.1 LysR substrate-binding domain-containing protein [Caballeronia zhejiangensis]MCI1043985.1 LysR family transcriptional regulator [Caballeronia zhejiangensis]MDR5769956.1 LysR substrate-binding domain-containing protein [Caballeronia sp. LZ028]